MTYKILTTEKFDKAFKKLDKQTQKIIKSWVDKNLVGCENPRIHGNRLTADLGQYWRYRVGDYRILGDIQDDKLVLIFIDIGHRSSIYQI